MNAFLVALGSLSAEELMELTMTPYRDLRTTEADA